MPSRGPNLTSRSRRGVLTTLSCADEFDLFLSRQRSRVHDRAHRLYQRHQRRVGEHLQATSSSTDFETRGLPQPWNRSLTDHRL